MPASTAQEHFEQLVNQWYDPLFRFALTLTRDPEEARDLTQNAFLKWAQKGHRLRVAEKAKTWLFSVVHHAFIDQVRRQQRHPSVPVDDVELPATARISDANNAEKALDADTVLDAMSQLDERFRAPLALFYLEGHSYQEIAEILEVPIGTVMSRLRRAKDHLRVFLETPPAAQTDTNIHPFRKEASS